MAEKLTTKQKEWLVKIVAAYPEAVTVDDLSVNMRALEERELIMHWDMWPDGRVRYLAIPAAARLAWRTPMIDELRRDEWLEAAVKYLDAHPASNPRFAQMPYRLHEPMPWRGRSKKRNPNAAKQAAAKQARRTTRRSAR